MASRSDVVTLRSRSRAGDDDAADHVGHARHRDLCLAAHPAVIAARAMLRDVAGADLQRMDLHPRALLLVVPHRSWDWAVVEAFRFLAKGGREPERAALIGWGPLEEAAWLALLPAGRRADSILDEAEAVLGAGGQLVVVTDDAASLPPALRACMDRELVMTAMDWATLRHVCEEVCGLEAGWPVVPRPDADLIASIVPADLRLAQRPGTLASEYAARVLRIAAARCKPGDGNALTAQVIVRQGLARVPGMGAALEWGRTLAADLRAFHEGRLPWSAVDPGAVLVGPPGTGKTSFARALAEECGVPLVATSYGEWQAAGHQGEMLKAMRACFASARAQAPCLLFIDELDSFPMRGKQGREHESYLRQVVNALLAEMDGVRRREGVVVVAACNEVDGVEPAILRAGRLDRVIPVELPDMHGRAAILRVHLAEDLPGADLIQVAKLAEGMSGADLEKVVREARRAARMSGRRMLVGDLVVAVAAQAALILHPFVTGHMH